ncbi:MAG: ComEC/Rec2 family competence protein [Oscillospiraceae bacterium]|nr:ComEC/Rec2 family competence protein [Oscillospiraceae bacterium]
MKRKMVIIGISYILGLFFASFFTSGNFWVMVPVIGTVTAILILFKAVTLKTALVWSVSFFTGVFLYTGYLVDHYEPAVSMAGEKTSFSGMVKSSEIYDGGYASYILEGSFENGTKASVLCFTYNYDCRYGDYMKVKGTFAVPEKTYLFDSTEYYRGMSVFLEAESDCEYEVTYTDAHHIVRKVSSYRERIQRRLYALCGKTGGSLTSAMIFGRREKLDERIESAFYHAGIGPMLALSGFHLILFNGICNIFGNRTRLQRILQLAMTIVLTGLFSVIAMWPVSVLRAGIMLLIARSGCLFFRRADSLSSLCFSIIVLTFMQPFLIHNVGFLLSVAGTFGVTSFAPWIMEKLPLSGWSGAFAKTALSAVVVSLCTIPVCIRFFPKISLLAPISNIVFGPMCIIIMFLGIVIFFLGGESFVCTLCGKAIDAVSVLLTDCLLWMQDNILIAFPSGWAELSEAALILAAMTAGIYILTKSRKMVAFSAALSVVVMLSGQYILTRRFEDSLRIFVLGRSNGHIIAVTYNGRTDVAELSYDKKNPDYLRTFLNEYNITNIDTLYISGNANASASAYNKKLSGIKTERIFVGSELCYGKNGMICSKNAELAHEGTVTSSLYEISVSDGILTVSAYGKVMLVSHKEKIRPDSINCDYLTVLGKRKADLFEISAENENNLLCQCNNMEIVINENGTAYARRLY